MASFCRAPLLAPGPVGPVGARHVGTGRLFVLGVAGVATIYTLLIQTRPIWDGQS